MSYNNLSSKAFVIKIDYETLKVKHQTNVSNINANVHQITN